MTDPTVVAGEAFPGNVVKVLAEEYPRIPDVERVGGVVARPLNRLDSNFMIGVVALHWEPGGTERSGQSQLLGQNESTLNTYNFMVQGLVKTMDEEVGIASSSLFAKIIRTMLYRDPRVRLRLSQLSEVSLGFHERFSKLVVRSQRYASNEVEGNWLYLSVTDFAVVTETVPA